MDYLLLNSTAALHTSAPCPRVISSGKTSSPSRGGSSFWSKWLSKVDLMLCTGGERGRSGMENIAMVVHQLFPTQAFLDFSLASCFFSGIDLWLRGHNLSCFPLTDGCPEGVALLSWVSKGSKFKGECWARPPHFALIIAVLEQRIPLQRGGKLWTDNRHASYTQA